ncbi:MAG: SAF domain-containing protein [Acidobacteriota bacterium]|nr:SAF domain-containing protein [Acidobacteriota bacterium]
MTPTEALTRLVRAARWHRRALGTIAAIICLFSVLSVLAPQEPETTPALVAGHALAAGTLLTETDLRTVEIPLAYLPEGALVDSAEAIGRTLTGALTAGSVLTSASTLSGRNGGAGPNERLVPFRVPDSTTAALLQVGDRITVVGATVDGTAIDLASGVRVAALPAAGGNGSLGGESGAVVVVAADPQTAATLAAASTQMRMAIVLG